MKFGYIRVSCADKQEFYRQEYILQQHNIDKVFEEKISGTKRASTRPEFEKMLCELSAGDEVYFESMSRMARSMHDLIDTTNMLVKGKVKVVFIKENISLGGDSSNDAMSALIFNIMGAFAQFERDLIADRTKQGLKARRELLGDGFKIGRPKHEIDPIIVKKIKELYGLVPVSAIQREVGLSRKVVDRIIKEEIKNKKTL